MAEEQDNEFGRNLHRQVFEIWVDPELERRRKAQQLPAGFQLLSFQLVMAMDKDHEVRLNSEVKGHLNVKLRKRDSEPTPGELIMFDDVEEFGGFELPKSEADSAHLTGVLLSRGGRTHWVFFFDFRYNRGKASKDLERSRQFLEVAEHALEKGLLGPAAENGFNAYELAARAVLLLFPDERILNTKSHDGVATLLNQYARPLNVPREMIKGFNRLSQARPSARYGDLRCNEQQIREWINYARELGEFAGRRI